MNNYTIVRKMGIFLIIILILLNVTYFFMYFCTRIVIGDFYEVLYKMEHLEKEGLLSNPPDSISTFIREEMKTWENSSELKEYIRSAEEDFLQLDKRFSIFIILLVLTISIFLTLKFMDWKLSMTSKKE